MNVTEVAEGVQGMFGRSADSTDIQTIRSVNAGTARRSSHDLGVTKPNDHDRVA
jgi:hypothetical protein